MILSAPHNADNDTADAALETRFYPLQNWRADVVCVGKLSGGGFQLVEVVDYDTYGNAVSRPAISADFNRDGGVDGSDQDDFFAAFFAGEPSADIDLNGGIEGGDLGLWFDVFESGVSGPSRGACTNSGVIAGYAGYVRDRWAPDLYHVRHRVYDTRMGTWTKRDPLGYVDGLGLYEYVKSSSIGNIDPDGRCSIDIPRGCPPFDPRTFVPDPAWWCDDGGEGPYFETPDCTILGIRYAFRGCARVRAKRGYVPIANGCGAGPVTNLPPRATGFAPLFTPCCNTHDICYGTCGSTRSACDKSFRDCLFAACRNAAMAPGARIGFRTECEAAAFIIATAVEQAGGSFFCGAQSEACVCSNNLVNP